MMVGKEALMIDREAMQQIRADLGALQPPVLSLYVER